MGILDRFAREKSWSSRSQLSYLQQWQLQDALERTEGTLAWEKKYLADAESLAEHQVRNAGNLEGAGDFFLTKVLHEIRDRKDTIEALTKHEDSLRSQIAALENPGPEKSEDRARHQAVLAQLVKDRLQRDKQADSILQQLRFLLKERQKLTASMAEAGAAIDLTVAPDGLDENRFVALLGVLPGELAGTSEKWVARFLGQEEDKTPFKKSGKYFTRCETLASANASKSPSGAQAIVKSGMVTEPLQTVPT